VLNTHLLLPIPNSKSIAKMSLPLGVKPAHPALWRSQLLRLQLLLLWLDGLAPPKAVL